MAPARRTIPASALPAPTSAATAVQGIVRTRITKSNQARRKPSAKHLDLTLPDIKAAVKAATAAFEYLPPTSPVSVPPSPTPPCKVPSPPVVPKDAQQAAPIVAKPAPSAIKVAPKAAPIVTGPAKPAASVADRLSVSYVPQGKLVGREEEAQRLHSSLSELLQPESPSGSVYVCGVPGTGKTLTITRVVEHLNARAVWVNCANLKRPADVFERLATDLKLEPQKDALTSLRQYAASDGDKTVLVLDEVDFLTTRDQRVLYALFELSKGESSRLVVVGIANALDLPTRLLPWLRAGGCLPSVHAFMPYTSGALTAILRQRLDRKEMSDAAVALAAKKVAAGSGDARAALDVVRESITNGAGGVAAVARVAASKGTRAAVGTIRGLPVVQQLALVAAANATSSAGAKRATLGGLHEGFTRLCRRAHIPPLNFADFADVCANALVSHALVDVPLGRGKAARSMRGRQVRLRVSADDVKSGVSDRGFLPFLLDAM